MERRGVRIAILSVPNCHALEVTGPSDVFAEAEVQSAGRVRYEVEVIAQEPGPVHCTAGLQILPRRTIHDPDEPIDTLLVAGARHLASGQPNPAVVDWLRRQAPRVRRLGSVCTGAFLLGAAGLLDGKRVTTHWEYAPTLARSFPRAVVEPNRIFLRDGTTFSSAGVSAGIDLALALIEEDHGRALALSVARWLVVFLKRPGGQSQFSVQLAEQIEARSSIEDVQQWIRDRPATDLSVGELARQAGMSERNFSRQFRGDTGMTPAAYVEAARLDAARALLESTTLSLQRIADTCGFAGTDARRRAVQRRLGVTALEYRRRFRAITPPA